MSNVIHYGIAATIARSMEESSATDKAYVDSQISLTVNSTTVANETLNTKIDDSVSALTNSINTKVSQTDFDNVLNPVMSEMTIV